MASTTITPSQRRVKHLRLFHFRDPESAAVRWLLHYIGKTDAVEFIEVNGIAGDTLSEEYRRRNPYQTVPFLEVILDGTDANPPWGTKRVADLTPWKPDQPCTVTNAAGDIVADPSDRVFPLTESGSICAFLCEHFEVPKARSLRLDPSCSNSFHRCCVQEAIGHNDLLARRIGAMVVIFIFTKAYGATEENVISAITAHERELLWTFRQIEETLISHERAAAAAAGVDYEALVQKGTEEVAVMERDEARAASLLSLALPQRSNASKSIPSAKYSGIPALSEDEVVDSPTQTNTDERTRGFTSPDLVALSAYMAGTTLSVADFCSGAYIQHLPFLQSWLPGSLKQRNFPAMLRYNERLRGLRGHGEALKPALTLLKAFRRRPQLLSDDPVVNVHAHRLKQLLDSRPAATAEGQRTTHRSDPRLLPQQHSRAAERAHLQSSHGDGRSSNVASSVGGETVAVGTTSVDFEKPSTKAAPESETSADSPVTQQQQQRSDVRIRGRPQNITPWAARMSTAPLCHPHTLSEQDEAALLQSKRPVMKRSAQSVDTRKMPTIRVGGKNTPMPSTMLTIPSAKDTAATFSISPGEAMATTTRSRTVQPSNERRAPESPQSQWWQHDPYKASPVPTAPTDFPRPGGTGMGMGLPPHLKPPPPPAFLAGY